jgi:O-antigen ligase
MFSLPYDVLVPSWFPVWLQENLSIPRIAGIVLILTFLANTHLRPWKRPRAWAAFVAFVFIFAFSMLRSSLAEASIVFQLVQKLALFVIAYNLFLRGCTRGGLLSFCVSCAVVSVMIITGTSVDADQAVALGGRLSAFGADPNIYSGILIIGALAAIGIAHERKDRIKRSWPLLWVVSLVTAIAVVLSGSRGSTLGLGVGLATFLVGEDFWGRRLVKTVVLAAATMAALWVLSGDDVLMGRWGATMETGNTSGRDRIASEAIEMVKERPFVGWGPAATRVLAVRLNYPLPERATHNMALAMLTFCGALGALPYFYAYLAVLAAAWRSRGGLEGALPLAIFAAFFVTDMATGGLPSKLHFVFFAYLLAAGELVTNNPLSPRSFSTQPQFRPSLLQRA